METPDLLIDRNRLPEDLEKTPDEIKIWCLQLADAQKAMLKAEIKKDLVLAQTSIKIRQTPLDFGLAKVTEDAIKMRAEIEPAYQAALEDYVERKAEYTAIQAVVNGLDAKRASLKYLTELVTVGFIGMK